MKKWITFALVASCFGSHIFAQTVESTPVEIDEDLIIETKSDPNEFYIEEARIIPDFSLEEAFVEYEEPYNKEPLVADLSKLEHGRLLKEVNDTEGTDAYPFLSKDGLRLYWTQSGGGDHLVVASRKDIFSDFNAPQTLKMNFETGAVMSCWLSEDELTIYFKDGSSLTKASRSNINAAFEKPEKIQLHFKSTEDPKYTGFFSAPSLTQDENQLFLYQSLNGQRILQFERTANNEFTEVAVLEVDGDAEPGQLSQDGLSYSLTIKGDRHLHIFQREKLDQSFEYKEAIDLGSDFHQITHNEELMVLGFSPDDSWSTNELYIATYPLAKADVEIPQADKENMELPSLFVSTLDIFPNPAEQFVNLRFELPAGLKQAQLDIVDLQGKLIRTQQIQQAGTNTIQLEVQDLVSGTYICRLTGAGLEPLSKAFVVK